MLVTFNAISHHLADPDGPTMEIPTNVVAGLSGLLEYLHGQVIEPFFKNFRQDNMEAAWQSWTEWSRPLIDPLIDRVVNMSASTPELKELIKVVEQTRPERVTRKLAGEEVPFLDLDLLTVDIDHGDAL